MKIGVIVSSLRAASESARVGEFLASKLKEMSVDVWTLDLGKNPLPLWEEEPSVGKETWERIWKPIDTKLKDSEGFVIVVPEYNGMASPALKNFFLYAGLAQLGHKPALLASVSSGRGGAFPIQEIRGSSYKNSKICYLPEHLIFRESESLLHGAEPKGESDKFIRERSIFALKILLAYSAALSEVRESGVVSDPKFKNGMS